MGSTKDWLPDTLAAGDVSGFMNLWTDNGLEAVFYESSEAFVNNTGYYLGAKQYRLSLSSDPVVDGDTATVVAALYFRLVGVVRQFSLIKVEGSGKWTPLRWQLPTRETPK